VKNRHGNVTSLVERVLLTPQQTREMDGIAASSVLEARGQGARAHAAQRWPDRQPQTG